MMIPVVNGSVHKVRKQCQDLNATTFASCVTIRPDRGTYRAEEHVLQQFLDVDGFEFVVHVCVAVVEFLLYVRHDVTHVLLQRRARLVRLGDVVHVQTVRQVLDAAQLQEKRNCSRVVLRLLSCDKKYASSA